MCILIVFIFEPRHDKTNKMSVRPAKTQITLGIRPVWSESSLCAQWVAKDPSFLHADSEDWSDWADADLSLRWAHSHFVGFVMRRLICQGLRGVVDRGWWYHSDVIRTYDTANPDTSEVFYQRGSHNWLQCHWWRHATATERYQLS